MFPRLKSSLHTAQGCKGKKLGSDTYVKRGGVCIGMCLLDSLRHAPIRARDRYQCTANNDDLR